MEIKRSSNPESGITPMETKKSKPLFHRRVTNPASEEDKPPPSTSQPTKSNFAKRKRALPQSGSILSSTPISAVIRVARSSSPLSVKSMLLLSSLVFLLVFASTAEAARGRGRHARLHSRARLLASLPRQGRGSHRGKL